MSADPHVLRLVEVGAADVLRVGGKNASLGEMLRALGGVGVKVPPGFATAAAAYRELVAASGIGKAMQTRLDVFRRAEASLQETGAAIRRLFLGAELPASLAEAIRVAYRELGRRRGMAEPAVAVRSSATAEDLPNASFAGQQETFLNVVGERALLDAYRHCYASLFTDRAISYREMQGFDHLGVALSIGVQAMVRADLGGSGIMFSIDTESGFPGVVIISAAWGLGEPIVQGSVDPDRYLVFKPPLEECARCRSSTERLGPRRARWSTPSTAAPARRWWKPPGASARASF